MSKRRKKRVRTRTRYLPSPIAGLMVHPTILLLNLMVRSAEDNAITDGLIPPETVDEVTALIRHAYDLPDLDRDQGRGVLLSLIGQFFHPDDYLELGIADVHVQALCNAIQGELQSQSLETPDLRRSNVSDPADMAAGDETVLPLYYKQRFLSFCFVGESAQLDKLQGDIPTDLLDQVLGTLWYHLGISHETFVITHPAFVPARQVERVSVQDALEWTKQMTAFMEELAEKGTEARLSVIGPPGPSYTVRPKKRRSRGKKW